jgi:heme/copper-type cytochrome/quinol oxidase subunit 2
MTRRRLIALLAGAGGIAVMAPFDRTILGSAPALAAQEQVPSRREITITATNFAFKPDHVEAMQDDLVRITIRSTDVAHSFNIDEYRIAKRVPAGGSVVVEFRADRVGTFPFYCSISSEPGHEQMRGQLVVRAK